MEALVQLLQAAESVRSVADSVRTVTLGLTAVLYAALVGLASVAVLDAWLLGSLFAGQRARCEYWRDEGDWRATRLLGELLTCRFCLGYHVSFWLAILTMPLVPTAWPFPLVWLGGRAIERLAHRVLRGEETEVKDEPAGPDEQAAQTEF